MKPLRLRSLDRSSTAAALEQRSRKGKLKYNDLPAPLRRAVLLHWGSMAAARKELGLARLMPPRQVWSQKRVLDEMRKLARAGKHMSVTALLNDGRADLVLAARTYAGNWTRARQLAGISFKRQRPRTTIAWDASMVVAEIRDRHSTGLELAVTKCPRSLVSAAQRLFGSWREAVDSAGISYESVMLLRAYSDDELLAWLRELARQQPDLSPFGIDQHGEHAVACRRRWGSYRAAAAAAGLVDWPVRKREPAASRSDVLRALRKRHAARSVMSLDALEKTPGGNALINSVLHHFATWTKALRAAGVRTRSAAPAVRRKKQAL